MRWAGRFVGALIAALPALPAAAVTGTPGLVGTYFNNTTLTAPAAMVRVDSGVNFAWAAASPDLTVATDNFSVRWTGTLRVQATGSYTFRTVSDDGVRLSVNGTLLIDNWTAHALATDTSTAVTLTAGVDYPVTLDYYETTLNATIALLWLKPGDVVYTPVPADNGSLGLSTGLAPAFEMRFEESAWNGTAAEVRDTSALSGWHGTAAGLGAARPTTANATPATGSIAGSCNYGVFNRANKEYVALPASFPNLGSNSSFTVTAWLRATDPSLPNQRVFADDENGYPLTAAGYGLSLGDAGTGTLRFYTRALATRNLDTGAVVAANTWVFVAFSVDLSTRTKRLMVYDTSGALLASVSDVFIEATIGVDAGPASIGAETNAAGGSENTSAYGFGGNIDEVRMYPWALSTTDLASVRTIAPPCPAIVARTPGRFNAFESATAAGSITGVIHTKVAGSAFGLDVVAIDLAGTAVLPGFTGAVRVELLDGSDSSGALDATSNCRASWSAIPGGSTPTLTFAGADAGRKALASLTEADAWRELRVRISYPSTGTATAVGCSTDAFAIRPSAFTAFTATDADALTAGTARSLANTGATGGVVHKAGRPFRLSASAVNAASTPAVTSRYNGTPGATLSACAGSGCPSTPGVMSVGTAAVAGVISSNAASYSEAGSFNVQLADSTWAAVDANDGSTLAERQIVSPIAAIGRFVPDYFALGPLVTPVLRTFGSGACAARSFTYAGQPFGWATAPQASITAMNAAGATTANYAGTLWKATATGVTQTYTPNIGATPGLDASGVQVPTVSSNGNGTGVLRASSSDAFKVVRPPAAPLAPFDAAFGLSWSLTDSSEAAVSGNGSIATTTPLAYAPLAFDAGSAFRYGVLKLASAYGSELVDLAVPIETQVWDGLRFATNTADHCTALPAASVALGNWQRQLAACETSPGGASVQLSAGRAVLRFAKPGAGNAGSVDATVNLGDTATGMACTAIGAAASAAVPAATSWLQGRAAGSASFDRNPTSRLSFGQHKGPLVQLREVY